MPFASGNVMCHHASTNLAGAALPECALYGGCQSTVGQSKEWSLLPILRVLDKNLLIRDKEYKRDGI